MNAGPVVMKRKNLWNMEAPIHIVAMMIMISGQELCIRDGLSAVSSFLFACLMMISLKES